MTLNPADAAFRARLAADLPDDTLHEAGERYLEEPRGIYAGRRSLLALPRSAQEVAALIRHANDAQVGVIPYGGGTGLVGGQVAPDGPAPLIISLERMNKLRDAYPDENVLVAEAGVILADVQTAADAVERLFPLSLASEGSARIGGNLSTNAGGTGVLRYGNTRDLCLGLEAVLPDGQIWNGLTRLRKNNTGYDLRHLLIGAEGTLGVITAAALKIFPKPARMGTALLVVKSPRAALDLLSLARGQLGEMISGFELIHRQGMEFLAETLPEVRLPFADLPEWTVLIDVGLSGDLDPSDALETLFAAAHEAGFVSDGLIAQSAAQSAAFWNVREMIPEGNRRIGSISSHDISVPLGMIPEFITKAGQVLDRIGDFRINCFGHVGDGNLHYNVFPLKGNSRADHENQKPAIKAAVHDLVHEMGGSFSAEHGVGRMKRADLEHYGDPAKLSAMRAIKAALDPNGIMNPGAVLGT
ncbi:FAD-binding oxidoreductase [Sulfitobacter sp. M57]|uniref:FAD-binding oxidoreductase n=1 Tax=unclassified Sulfitobacter TaxID=196795 RepID=UPI0023E15F59|nr:MULTISPECIES: FAD-binding oxidoreductase [unclassified Sulfitobacter]MDF3412995.1 FAD-binding oxidoreductase [Sulfitobacter sp. KE5]MDF3421721.1 FAD-binding oxidoreductase [Sulfitobacter sp. KE43]MDF3431544.1 FAD-binding oxidoreductase [Sulfitobacter sp. KE42]MDF3457185.1 FAD-binding oxidoreductase [Sulfitobacter sp. S74]MDF3461088.1 FAD-binding oxidoreductase [Sulfitobacter sp. Ks18]